MIDFMDYLVAGIALLCHLLALYTSYKHGLEKGERNILREIQDQSDFLAWFVIEEDYVKDGSKLIAGELIQCKGVNHEIYFPRGLKVRPAKTREILKEVEG